MDLASLCGLLLAIAAIIGGMLLEGGSLAQIVQPTAFLIVMGGTAGAVMLQFSPQVFLYALKQGTCVFLDKPPDNEIVINQLVVFAAKARRSGILSIDADLNSVEDPFLKQALTCAVDITSAVDVRAMVELQMENEAERQEKVPHVFEAMGGYSPTVGILGAVLGLIQVMQHLDDIAAVGRGIAVAFVATIYGVAFANLVALPIAGKLKIHQEQQHRRQSMMLEGVVLILEGMAPRMIEARLRTYLDANTLNSTSPAKEAAERVTA